MLSEQQKLYFKDSKLRDANGALVPMYHGTGTTITAFSPDFTAQGNDQYGSGFYFASDHSFAEAYTTATVMGDDGRSLPKLGGTDNPNVVEAYLNLTNPYVVDGARYANMGHIELDGETAYRILLQHPDLYLPQNGPDAEVENPLGDFYEDYWRKKRYSQEEYRHFIRRLAMDYFNPSTFKMLDIFFGRHGKEFRTAMRDVTGHDGVIIKFSNGTIHAVAWFPNQIKAITNLEPTEAEDIRV